jgi:hypothetical protein
MKSALTMQAVKAVRGKPEEKEPADEEKDGSFA